jgi:hypothetical protein
VSIGVGRRTRRDPRLWCLLSRFKLRRYRPAVRACAFLSARTPGTRHGGHPAQVSGTAQRPRSAVVSRYRSVVIACWLPLLPLAPLACLGPTDR